MGREGVPQRCQCSCSSPRGRAWPPNGCLGGGGGAARPRAIRAENGCWGKVGCGVLVALRADCGTCSPRGTSLASPHPYLPLGSDLPSAQAPILGTVFFSLQKESCRWGRFASAVRRESKADGHQEGPSSACRPMLDSRIMMSVVSTLVLPTMALKLSRTRLCSFGLQTWVDGGLPRSWLGFSGGGTCNAMLCPTMAASAP
mmetsp:Transcript_47705/g.96308  ORF Transcript_47705/g.96308 Transcript_47705/m.96308 type:complete len:201 (+) Transcript_47705:488-1090(+)